MKARIWTGVLLTGLSAVLAYEIQAAINVAPGDTISEIVWRAGQHPMFAFLAGVLVGHLWWQRKPR